MERVDCLYGHLFDAQMGDIELDFDLLIVDVEEGNMNVLFPILAKILRKEEQKQQLKDLAEQLNFDLSKLGPEGDFAPQYNA